MEHSNPLLDYVLYICALSSEYVIRCALLRAETTDETVASATNTTKSQSYIVAVFLVIFSQFFFVWLCHKARVCMFPFRRFLLRAVCVSFWSQMRSINVYCYITELFRKVIEIDENIFYSSEAVVEAMWCSSYMYNICLLIENS